LNLIAKFKVLFGGYVQSQPEPPWPKSVFAELPPDDSVEERASARDDEALGYAEGQSFIIEYRDSQGRSSRRRITVWGIKRGVDGVPLLVAKCHERKATRSFRIDRILAVIDYDGVVQEPLDRFFEDTFGMHADELAPRSSSERSHKPVGPIIKKQGITLEMDPVERWSMIRAACRDHGLHLLATLARSDGELHPNELEVMVDFVAELSAKMGITIDVGQSDQIRDYVKRLRPTFEVIDRTIDRVLARPPSDIKNLLAFGRRVIEADGLLHPAELSALQDLEKSLIPG
jgi:hypothetical protein